MSKVHLGRFKRVRRKRGVTRILVKEAEKSLSKRNFFKYSSNKISDKFFPFVTLIIAVLAIGLMQVFFPTDNLLTGGAFASQIDSCGQTTNATNTVYELTQNLNIGAFNPCFQVGHANTTIDCKNFAIIGTGSADTARGVRVQAADGFRLQNCTIKDFGSGRGIQMRSGSDSAVIRNSTFSGNNYGIELWGSDSLLIFNISMINLEFLFNTFGVRGLNSSGNVTNISVVDSLFFGNNDGMLIEDGGVSNFTVQSNNFTLNNDSGVEITDNSHNNTIFNNHFDRNGNALFAVLATAEGGVFIDNAARSNLILSNNFTHNSSFISRGVQIRDAASNNTIMDNNATNLTSFIFANNAQNDNNTLINNKITNNLDAMILQGGFFWQIINNTFEQENQAINTSLAIQLNQVENSTIRNNTFMNIIASGSLIQLLLANNTLVSNNYISATDISTSNGASGSAAILVGASSSGGIRLNNNITNNSINSNFTFGIRLIANNFSLVNNNTLSGTFGGMDIGISVEFNPSNISLISSNNTLENNTVFFTKSSYVLNDFTTNTGLISNNGGGGSVIIYNLSRSLTGNYTNNIQNTLIQFGSPSSPNKSILFILGANNTRYFVNKSGLDPKSGLNNSIIVDSREIAIDAHECGGLLIDQLGTSSYGTSIKTERCNDINVSAGLWLGTASRSTVGAILIDGFNINISGVLVFNMNKTGILTYNINNSFFENNSFSTMPSGSTWMKLIKSFSNNITNFSGASGGVGVEIDLFSGFNNVRDCPTFGALTTASLLLDFFSTNTSYDCDNNTVIEQDFSANNSGIGVAGG